jgi:hypothetical protein
MKLAMWLGFRTALPQERRLAKPVGTNPCSLYFLERAGVKEFHCRGRQLAAGTGLHSLLPSFALTTRIAGG